MQVFSKKMALITGLTVGLMALAVAHGDGEGMTVLMNSNFVTADPENIKWAPAAGLTGMGRGMGGGAPSELVGIWPALVDKALVDTHVTVAVEEV